MRREHTPDIPRQLAGQFPSKQRLHVDSWCRACNSETLVHGVENTSLRLLSSNCRIARPAPSPRLSSVARCAGLRVAVPLTHGSRTRRGLYAFRLADSPSLTLTGCFSSLGLHRAGFYTRDSRIFVTYKFSSVRNDSSTMRSRS